MRNRLKNLLTEVGRDGYGPRAENPIYEANSKDTGATYTLSRHHWSFPEHKWGWQVKEKGTGYRVSAYFDTLSECLHFLGYSWEEMGE